jgi:Glyoxal oxidase N-terminus
VKSVIVVKPVMTNLVRRKPSCFHRSEALRKFLGPPLLNYSILILGNVNGLQGIRMFTPCGTGNCDIIESPTRVRLTSPRWYPTAARLDDGSVIIFGGQFGGG